MFEHHVLDDLHFISSRAVHCKMLDKSRSLVLEVSYEVIVQRRGCHEVGAHFVDPWRHSGWEKNDLRRLLLFLLNSLKDSFNVFLKAHIKHSISLVEDDSLNLAQVELPLLNEVETSASSANDEVRSLPDLIELVCDGLSSIHWDHSEFWWGVLKFIQFRCDLQGKLSGWSKHKCKCVSFFKLLFLSHPLDQWKAKS